jgi:hypothetical protein
MQDQLGVFPRVTVSLMILLISGVLLFQFMIFYLKFASSWLLLGLVFLTEVRSWFEVWIFAMDPGIHFLLVMQ